MMSDSPPDRRPGRAHRPGQQPLVRGRPRPRTGLGAGRLPGPTCLDPASTSEPAPAARPRPGVAAPASTTASCPRQQQAASRSAPRRSWPPSAKPGGGGTAAPSRRAGVPVYIHVMADANGNGNVTDAQITQQIAELNQDFAGGESSSAANTGFTFSLAGTDRYYNTQWHQDKSSTTYRSQTRLGGANALNIWLVDFAYLGIATFPWDYARNPSIDGIRVEYTSLPGGSATNYNQGKTASHEAGHWFGLYHTFQGGCTSTNDEVSDTPAQASADQRLPRRAATPARCRAWTRSTTTWTTATTPATTSSPRTRPRGRSRCSPPTAPRPRVVRATREGRSLGGLSVGQTLLVPGTPWSGEGLLVPGSELGDARGTRPGRRRNPAAARPSRSARRWPTAGRPATVLPTIDA